MANTVNPIIDRIRRELTELKGLDKSQAHTMSPVYYTSPAFLELEKEHIFRKEWICVGHVGEVPDPGDFYTTELVEEQLLVVRGSDGQVRVLSNVCRHRANMIAQGAGNAKRFVCGYHAWTYAPEGELLNAPLMARVEGFDKKKCHLHGFKTEIWKGFIFVNLDGKATPLAPRLVGLEPLIGNYHIEQRHLVHKAEAVWNTNWKNLTENFMEGYHLSATHTTTLHPMTPTSLSEKFPGGVGYTGFKSHLSPNFPERGPFHPDMTMEERRYSVLFCAYPSMVVAVATNITLYLCLRPASADSVAIRMGLIGVVDDKEHQVVKDYVALLNAFNAEDQAKLETLQKGMKTHYYHPGPLAPEDFEGTIWDILNFMASRLGIDVPLEA